MATIFRGPFFASPQRKPPQPSVLFNPGLLVPALLLSGAVPFKSPVEEVVVQQHPSHARSANADTSRGIPKTLFADAVRPTFNPAPIAPPNRPNSAVDTTQDTPLTLLAAAAPAPFYNPPALRVDFSRNLTDTSRGCFNLTDVSVAVAQLEFLPAPHLKRIGSETSKGSFRALFAAVTQSPFVNAPYAVVWPARNLNDDATRGVVPTYMLSGITGTLAVSNANDTLAATGTSTVSGTLAKSNANDTLAATGSSTVSGSLAKSNANDTLAATGSSTVTGSLATSNANDTLAASGTAGNGTNGLAYTNANDTLAATGSSTVTGSLAQANANDTLSAAGSPTVTGLLAVTNANDSLLATGGSIDGTVNVTNNNDTLSAFGTAGLEQGGGGGKKKKKHRPVVDELGQLHDASQAAEDKREAIVAKRYPESALKPQPQLQDKKPDDDDELRELLFILNL